MKQRLLLAFFALSLFITSCGSDNDLNGNWRYDSEFSGTKRSGAVSFVIGNEKDQNQTLFIGTGFDGKDELKTFYKYSTNKGWERIEDFPGDARRDAVAFVVNGKGYVGTGVKEDIRYKDFYEYTPEIDDAGNEIGKWKKTPIAEFPGSKRQGAVAFSIGNEAYVGTGYGFLEGVDRKFLNDFYKYNGEVWSKIDFKGKKSRFTTAFVIKEKAYIVSGDGSLQDVWEYDPKADVNWTKKDPLDKRHNRENVQRSNAVSFVINELGYIVTGKNSSLSREVWEYDPTRDEWVERTSLENEVSPRQDALGFSLNGKGFITTGFNGRYLGDTWEFQPTVGENEDDNY